MSSESRFLTHRFDDKEHSILLQHVEAFRIGTKADRKQLLRTTVLPTLKKLKNDVSGAEWELYKHVCYCASCSMFKHLTDLVFRL